MGFGACTVSGWGTRGRSEKLREIGTHKLSSRIKAGAVEVEKYGQVACISCMARILKASLTKSF